MADPLNSSRESTKAKLSPELHDSPIVKQLEEFERQELENILDQNMGNAILKDLTGEIDDDNTTETSRGSADGPEF